MLKRNTIAAMSAASAVFSMGASTAIVVPRHTNKLIRDSNRMIKSQKDRRIRVARVPSIYISGLAQKAFGQISKNV